MDLLFELLFEILGGVLETTIESDRVPKWIRYLLLVLLFGCILALIITGILHAEGIALTVFLLILAAGLIALLIYFVYQIHRSGILRQAKQDDLPEILRMYRSLIGKNGCDWTVMYPNEVTLHEDFAFGNLYVLSRGRKLIGAASIRTKNVFDHLPNWYYHDQPREITRIVIAPAYQGKGYGKHLVNKLCGKLEYMHCQVVRVLVKKDNHPALNLFRETKFRNRGQYEYDGQTYEAYERKL